MPGGQLRFAEFHCGIEAAETEALLVQVVAVGHLPAQHDLAVRLGGVAESLLGAQQLGSAAPAASSAASISRRIRIIVIRRSAKWRDPATLARIQSR
jgi:hypothetical protein